MSLTSKAGIKSHSSLTCCPPPLVLAHLGSAASSLTPFTTLLRPHEPLSVYPAVRIIFPNINFLCLEPSSGLPLHLEAQLNFFFLLKHPPGALKSPSHPHPHQGCFLPPTCQLSSFQTYQHRLPFPTLGLGRLPTHQQLFLPPSSLISFSFIFSLAPFFFLSYLVIPSSTRPSAP